LADAGPKKLSVTCLKNLNPLLVGNQLQVAGCNRERMGYLAVLTAVGGIFLLCLGLGFLIGLQLGFQAGLFTFTLAVLGVAVIDFLVADFRFRKGKVSSTVLFVRLGITHVIAIVSVVLLLIQASKHASLGFFCSFVIVSVVFDVGAAV